MKEVEPGISCIICFTSFTRLHAGYKWLYKRIWGGMETGLRSILKTDEGRRDREETGRIRESRIQQWATASKCLKKKHTQISTDDPCTKNKTESFAQTGSPALSNRLYFNITTETQSPVSLYSSVSQRACWVYAAETPCLPITSMLGPRHVKAAPISRRIHPLHRMLTDSILFSLRPLLTWQRKWRGGEGRRGKAGIKRIGRYGKNRGRREQVSTATPVR